MPGNVLNKCKKKDIELIMAKCPNCKKQFDQPKKTWKYGKKFKHINVTVAQDLESTQQMENTVSR